MALAVLALGIGLFSHVAVWDVGFLENGWIGPKIDFGDRTIGFGIWVSPNPAEKESVNQMNSNACPNAKRNLIVLVGHENGATGNGSIELGMEE